MAGNDSSIDTSELGEAIRDIGANEPESSGFIVEDGTSGGSRSGNTGTPFGGGISGILGRIGRSNPDNGNGAGAGGGSAYDSSGEAKTPQRMEPPSKSQPNLKIQSDVRSLIKGVYHSASKTLGPHWELETEELDLISNPLARLLRSLNVGENVPPKWLIVFSLAAIGLVTVPKVVQTVAMSSQMNAGAQQAVQDIQRMMQARQQAAQQAQEPQPDGEVPLGERVVTPKDELRPFVAAI